MRYIVFEDFSGQPAPILFPDRIDFEEMREQIPYSKALSAGRIEFVAGELRCRSEANDLGLKKSELDQEILVRHFAPSDD